MACQNVKNDRNWFGILAATAAFAVISQGAFADGAPKAKIVAKPAGKCVHDCAGYAQCKGNGNNSCKGKNSCANEGLVPKECSSQTTNDACATVVDAKQKTMCSWRD